MSVTLTLDDEIDISRGDMLTIEPPTVGTEFEAEVVWMDERPLDPGRVYLLKQSTRTVTAEIHHGLVLNQIGTVNVSTARPLVFDRYAENRATGSFIIIDPATQFTAGAGHDHRTRCTTRSTAVNAPISAAERLAQLARRAGSDAEAVEADPQGARGDAVMSDDSQQSARDSVIATRSRGAPRRASRRASRPSASS